MEVAHIPTDRNPADLYTKILGSQPFARHRAAVLGLAAGQGACASRRAAELASLAQSMTDMGGKLTEVIHCDSAKEFERIAARRARIELDVRGAVLTSAGRLWDNEMWSAPKRSGGSV